MELKSFDNAGLITDKEKSSIFYCLFRFCWKFHLWSKLNSASHDSIGISTSNVVPWVSFPDVRSKWTFKLRLLEFEVIVSVQQMNLSMFIPSQRGLVRTYFANFSSSFQGVSTIGAPLFQRPTIRAPRRLLPSSGVKSFSSPSLRRTFFGSFKKLLNSGTSWKSQRKTRKLPSEAQVSLSLKNGSPS